MAHSLFLLSLQTKGIDVSGGLFDFNATLPLIAIQIVFLVSALDFLFYTPMCRVLDNRNTGIRSQLTEASELLTKTEDITNRYEVSLCQAKKVTRLAIENAQKTAQECVALEINRTQEKMELLVLKAIRQLDFQKESISKAVEEHVDSLSERIKHKLLSSGNNF